MYTIYKHKNIITGKCYIGQTKYTLEKRWKEHLHAINNKARNGYPFIRALKKYGKDAWISGVIATAQTKEKANELEEYYIQKYDTFNNGYNATLGGDYFEGYVHQSGKAHHATDKTMYTLYHKTLPTFVGTRLEFCEKYEATTGAFTKLLGGKLYRLKGFAFTEENLHVDKRSNKRLNKRSKQKQIPQAQLKSKFLRKFWKGIEKVSTEHYTDNSIKRFTPLERHIYNAKISERLKLNNPTKGKAREQHVKDAVSKMRRASADQTLRDWIHPEHGIVQNITSVALRDKFPGLQISHLKKITDKHHSYQSHKGWRLHEP